MIQQFIGELLSIHNDGGVIPANKGHLVGGSIDFNRIIEDSIETTNYLKTPIKVLTSDTDQVLL